MRQHFFKIIKIEKSQFNKQLEGQFIKLKDIMSSKRVDSFINKHSSHFFLFIITLFRSPHLLKQIPAIDMFFALNTNDFAKLTPGESIPID